MTETRYSGDLVRYHKDIHDAIPHATSMHRALGQEIAYFARTIGPEKLRILEIGCGHGKATEQILRENPGVTVDASDISVSMIARARRNLAQYVQDRKVYAHQEDAFKYLPSIPNESFDVFTSSWTLHNFTVPQRAHLVQEAHRILEHGGLFICMDKMYDESLSFPQMFQNQVRCYDVLSGEKEHVKKLIVEHEKEDAKDGVRIDRQGFIATLRRSGFNDVWSTLRVINDEVLCARKK